jgi:branched-chain amino acid transport system permease protein
MSEALAQSLVFGVLVGTIYGLAALGLSLVFGVTRFLNVSHGELLMYGGYASFWAFTLWGVDPYLTIPFSIIFLLLIGLVLYKLLFARMVRLPEETKIRNTLLIGFGLSLILQNIALRLWTADDRSIMAAYSGEALTLLGVRFPIVRLASVAIALVCFIALHQFLRRTYTGKAIRATVEDWEAAAMMGIDTNRVSQLAFVIGAALAGIAGTLVVISYSIEPSMGLDWTLIALIVMVLGGLGSIMGTLAGGIILGVSQAATSFFIGGNYREIVGLLIFLLVLILRPQGLFGTKRE